MAKKSTLQIVKNILSDLDSEDVTSIADSVEAQQISNVVKNVFENMCASRVVPEHNALVTFLDLNDLTRPTELGVSDTSVVAIKKIFSVEYNTGVSPNQQYKHLDFVEPEVFLSRSPKNGTTGALSVPTLPYGIEVYVYNDREPSYYTSFDDTRVIFDAYNVANTTALEADDFRVFAQTLPVFPTVETDLIDLDETLVQYLLEESKSICFSLFKGGTDPKIEQQARRLKSYIQDDKYKFDKGFKRPLYGRH
jgi:hypothetical protein